MKHVNDKLLTFSKIHKRIDKTKLYSMFAEITSLSTAKKVLSLNQPDTPLKKQLHEPRLVTGIQTGHKRLRSVTCLNEYMIWTSGETRGTKCFNVQGSLLQIIKPISVTTLTDNRNISG